MVVDCKTCGALVDAQELKSYWDADPSQEPASRFVFLRCPKCQQPFLIEESNWEPGEGLVLYPSIPQISKSLPKPIQAAFTEARTCFRNKSFTASTIMCRKTLEGICAAHQVSQRTLVASLKELKDRGIIEQRLFEWADALRISGNEAAHDVNVTIPAEDARDILEFTNALLEYVFTFRDKFEAFKRRRSEHNDT